MVQFSRAMSVVLVSVLFIGDLHGQQPAGRGPGFGRGAGFGRGRQAGKDERHAADHEDFHFLLTHHKQITRTVKNLPNGVETLTESTNAEVAAKIKEHVKWMKERVEKSRPIRMRDPLFAELFRHVDKIDFEYEQTDNGVRVTETSKDPMVVKLIQAHAKTVSAFVEKGFAEAMKNHAAPTRNDATAGKYITPAISNYGKVMPLPNAAQQPRERSKIVVDVTAGGAVDKLNPAIEKVARFVNIYAGAGKTPAKADIAIVLHGEATLAILNADAYGKRFKTAGNPNLDCLHQLHEAGVEIFVCGQSLVGKQARPEDAAVFVDVAVSALTSLVNLQADGYTYVPLK